MKIIKIILFNENNLNYFVIAHLLIRNCLLLKDSLYGKCVVWLTSKIKQFWFQWFWGKITLVVFENFKISKFS